MATKQEIQLEILNPEYSRFVRDQVLTEVQLNEILDFFEDQHRLTRTCLIGTGIVCGLHLQRKGSKITLSPGVAVTTDGDLLKMEASTFKYIANYIPPENGHYDPFFYQQDGQEKMIGLYELLTDEEREKRANDDILKLDDLDSILKDWVAILYLEYYLKDPEKCTPTNCDQLGMRQVARPKVLVLSKADMDKIIHKDEGEVIGDDIYLKYREAYEKYFTFPVIKARRVILNKFNTLKTNTLAGAYYNAAKDGSAALVEAITNLYQGFKFLIDKNGSLNLQPLMDELASRLTTPTDALFAQYTYDFYKDVVSTYNDLRDVVYNVAFECCPDIYSFPKHVMLGEPAVAGKPQSAEYRHQFYPSPAVSKNRELADEAVRLLERLKLIITGFTPKQTSPIRITPSRDYDRKLQERAIPFYYNNIQMLAGEWDYRKSLKGQEKLNLSYNSGLYEPPVRDEVLNPLDYDIDPYDFFRIEGHIGKDFKSVLRELDNLKLNKGIPMDVVAVRLGDVRLSDINLEDYECHFEDLNTMLRAFQVEMNCLLGDSTSFFSGFTPKRELPHINLQLYVAPEGQPKWIINKGLFSNVLKNNILENLRTTVADDSPLRLRRDKLAGMADKVVDISGLKAAGGLKDVGEIKDAGAIKDIGGTKAVNPALEFCDPFIKPVFSGDRIVKTKIDLNPETFGKYYLQALENETFSVDDFLEKARQAASADVELNQLNEDERFVVFEYPMQVIGNLNYIQRFIPSYLGDVNDKMISDYRDFTKSFCNRIKVMHTRLERYFKVGDYVSRGYETRYINMLDNLEKICCGHEKLEVILKEIEKRKADILKSLSFSRYAEQHPGLEHKAGVHRGGTFVIVYAGSGKSADRTRLLKDLLKKAADAGLGKALDAGSGTPQYRDSDTFAYFVASNEDTIDKEAELSNFLAFQRITAGTVFSERLIREVNDKIAGLRQVICRDLNQPEQDIVIADFCLPYLCCSDCPPVAFIVPKESKQLALPVDRACTNQEPIPFSAYFPKGAVIASPEAPDAVVSGDSPVFDPSKVPAAQLGKPVTFTLDGEPTDCTIVVTAPVGLNLTFERIDTDGDAFSVDYFNNTDESTFGKHAYIWKFNDGSPDMTRPDTSTFRITYSKKQLREQQIEKLEVTVLVQDDPCNSTGNLSIPVPPPVATDQCKDFVLTYIKGKRTVLTEPEFEKRVNMTGNSQVMDFYAGTVKLLDMAEKAVDPGDPALKLRVVVRCDSILKQLYQFQFDPAQENVRSILEELIRVLMMLLLNMIRCDDVVDPKAKEIIGSDLGMFHEMLDILLRKYFQLDAKNILELDVRDFAKNFKSQDPNIIGMLKVLLADLRKFPE